MIKENKENYNRIEINRITKSVLRDNIRSFQFYKQEKYQYEITQYRKKNSKGCALKSSFVVPINKVPDKDKGVAGTNLAVLMCNSWGELFPSLCQM